MEVSLIVGGRHADARGTLRFCNDFDMSLVKRFYTIANSAVQPKRGWIMHKRETKWFFPLRGKTTIQIEPMDHAPNDIVPESEYCLDAAEPKVLCVPPGHWFMIDQSDGPAEVQVFSSCHVGEFPNDDFRK